MKTCVIILFCLISSMAVLGQNETKQINVDVDEVQVTPPKFTGVENAAEMYTGEQLQLINQFIAKHFESPLQPILCNYEGTEVIEFTITPAGQLTDFNVINSVCREVDKELIRVLKGTNGMWLPGSNNGKSAAMEYEVSMMFGDYSQDEIINHFVGQSEKYFTRGSKTLLVEQQPRKALKYFDKSMRYTPNDKATLLLHGICSYELGKTENAKRDWNRIVSLGGIDYSINEDQLTEMKGYSEMIKILAGK